LNSEKIGKIWKKGKLNSERYEKHGRNPTWKWKDNGRYGEREVE
jgi:hypothetical protein